MTEHPEDVARRQVELAEALALQIEAVLRHFARLLGRSPD